LKKTKSTDIDDFVENITFTETKNYVRRVMRTYYLYSTLYNHS
jgi:soluble lytic murein transglycosylase-like protein